MYFSKNFEGKKCKNLSVKKTKFVKRCILAIRPDWSPLTEPFQRHITNLGWTELIHPRQRIHD